MYTTHAVKPFSTLDFSSSSNNAIRRISGGVLNVRSLANERTFRTPPEILLMALFDELLKSKVENGFTACVVYIYYLTNINFSLSRILMLHALLRLSVVGIAHRFLLMVVER